MALLDRLLHMGEGRTLKKLKAVAAQVNSIEADYLEMSDEELQAQTAELKQRRENGEGRHGKTQRLSCSRLGEMPAMQVSLPRSPG